MQKIILTSIIILTPLFSAVMQTELKNGLWQLIGFGGNHLSDSSVNYQEDIAREIIDIADENTTYLVKENSSDNAGLAYINQDYTLSTNYITTTTKLRSSIGIFAIKDSISPSGKTILKTNMNSVIRLKIKEARLYAPNIPKYRMYIKGKTNPVLRIDYQANYEGSFFRVKFGNEDEDYIAYFDNGKTFDNPTLLNPSSYANIDASIYSANIRDIIDFNANDNNLTEMILENKFKIKNSLGVYNQSLADYKSTNSYSVIVYQFKDGAWEIFNSENNSYSNLFDKLDIAKGYWIKIENGISNIDGNDTQTAIISKDNYNINDSAYRDIKNGWNISSFNNSYLRYSPSSIFIPMDLITSASFGGVSIYGKSNANASDRDIIALTSVYNNSTNASRIINILSQLHQDTYGKTHKLRSVPAIQVDINGNEIVGIVVVGDELFELNTSGNVSSIITTIAGGALRRLSNNNYGTVYGEYLNFMEINDLSGSDINATISIRMPKYNSSPKISSNLNDDNNTVVLMNALNTLRQSAIRSGETNTSTRIAGYLTTLDFNTNDDYSLESNMSHMLLASGDRYYISDSTHNKAYKFNRNGKFKLSSSRTSINIDSGSDTNITNLINAINTRASQTQIVATSLGVNSDGDTQFMISSTNKGLDLLENDSLNLFEDISLTSSNIANANFTRGSVTSVHTFLDLLNTDIFSRGKTDGITDTTITYIPDISDGSSIEIDPLNVDYTITYNGDLNLTGGITIPSGNTLTVNGNLIVNGALVIRGGARIIVGGDINITGQLVIDSGGALIVGKNGEATGNIIVHNGGLLSAKGTFTATSITDTTGNGFKVGDVPITSSTITSTISVSSILDYNVSGNPVGIFNTNGQSFPAITNNLTSNPLPTLDFPLSGGIIESMYENEKTIKTIMTMEYSSSNQGFWKITDLTKNIDTLYGNSYDSEDEYNNDYQGIFHLHPNKAYWVNIKSIDQSMIKPKNIQEAIVLEDSKLTMQSYTHFSNTFDKGVSTTQNHIDHRLNIKFKENNNFISSNKEDADYYNVVAIIKGIRYYLKRNGYYFSLDVNDNDMPLIEKIITKEAIQEKDESIILEAYDGTGLALKESRSDTHFKIKYFKPLMPSFTWSNDNDLIIDANSQKDIDNNISSLELYTRAISDIKSNRDKSLLKENNLSISKDRLLQWDYDDNESLHGSIIAIRAIIKKKDTSKEVSFYSDIKAFLYAPIKQGHKLEANSTNTTTTTKTDAKPYSYIQNKVLEKDNGVQLNYLNDNKNIRSISMAYYPQGKEGDKSLQGTGFGGSRTMFLRVNSGATNKEAIASISYLPEYIGKIFYISFDSKLYQGRFVSNDDFSNDGSAYNLESDIIGIDGFINGNSAQADDGGGMVVEGGQGI